MSANLLQAVRRIWQRRSRSRTPLPSAARRRRLTHEPLEDRCLLAGQPLEAHFDFGTSSSPVAANYTRLGNTTRYTAARGFGWQTGVVYGADRGSGTALDRDLNYTTDGTFAVDVPSGKYQVDLLLGDRGSSARDSMGVYLEGVLQDTVSTVARQVVSRRYQVEVADGQLTLRLKDLGGRDPFASIEALDVLQTGPLAPTLAISDASVLEGDSGTATLVFTVTLSRADTAPVSVDYGTASGTAAATDFVAQSGTLTIPEGQTSGTVRILVNGDTQLEPDETLLVSLSNPQGATLARSQGTGTILNDDVALVLGLAATPTAFLETAGANAATATVTRTGPTAAPLTVHLLSGNLSEVTVPETVAIPAGQSSVSFALAAHDVPGFHGTQRVTLTASADGFATASTSVWVQDEQQPPFVAAFDFGTATSPVSAGARQVSEKMRYTAAQGWGWLTGTILSVDRRTTSTLDCDLNYTGDGTFVVDVPNGTYQVDALLGDRGPYAHNQMGLFLEGTLRDTVSTAAGQVVSRSYTIAVTDGQLTVRLTAPGGNNAYACIEGLRVAAVGAQGPAASPAYWPTYADIPGAWFSEPTRDSSGFEVSTVTSQYQRTANKVRVLLPDRLTPGKAYRVIYVLPVEAGDGRQFGDGLTTVKQLNSQNTQDVIFVAPNFSDIPWYEDHISNQQLWQETYFRTVVVPFIEHRYPVLAQPEGRLLLGYSKSGYGAFSMFLRHPDEFGRALAWDQGMVTMDLNNPYGPLPIAGSAQNFENYRVTTLLRQQASLLQGQPPRLFLMGVTADSTRLEQQALDQLMTDLGIRHVYTSRQYSAHLWNAGWMPQAIDLLLG